MGRLTLVTVGAFLVLAATAAANSLFPETIALPTGFRPEGISIGNGTTFYVGSIPTGAVYRGDLRTGQGSVLVPPPLAGEPARAAIGTEFDRGLLYVAGGGTGRAFVYDAESGALVRDVQLASGPGDTFVNDVVVTRDAAYFTDTRRTVIYRLPLAPNGTPATAADVLTTGVAGLNGIEATPEGSALVAIQSTPGVLFRIDPLTGAATPIDLGGTLLPNGDGLLLHGKTLYVVQNRLNRIAVVTVAPDLGSGAVVDTITDPDFDVPTTIGRFGSHLYAVNARFGIPMPDAASYSVVKVER